MALLSEDVAPAADRQRFLEACLRVVQGGLAVDDVRQLLGAVDELSELCRRNARSRSAAQRALLPTELHYIVH